MFDYFLLRSQGHATIFLQLNTYNSEKLKYLPGDHLAVFPRNNQDIIQRFKRRLRNCPSDKTVIQLQVQGPNQDWDNYKRIPPCTFDTLLIRIIDLTNPPSQTTVQIMANSATDLKEKERLSFLAKVTFERF